MKDSEKLTRLAKVGIGCGPGCTCVLNVNGITEQQIVDIETSYGAFAQSAKVVSMSGAQFDLNSLLEVQRKRSGPLGFIQRLLQGIGRRQQTGKATA